jgi:CBS-domain-containing membrane protein
MNMVPWKNAALAWGGAVVAVAAIALTGDWTTLPLILGSFGASCVLVFGFPDLPFSRPRNVIAGHFLSSLIGLVFLTITGPCWWGLALAVGTAVAVMMLTGTVHPPAGSNPVIIFVGHSSWTFLLFPTLTGAVILVLVALLYNNLTRPTRYPQKW